MMKQLGKLCIIIGVVLLISGLVYGALDRVAYTQEQKDVLEYQKQQKEVENLVIDTTPPMKCGTITARYADGSEYEMYGTIKIVNNGRNGEPIEIEFYGE